MTNLQNTNEDPLKYLKIALEKWMYKDARPNFELRPVTLTETSQHIRKLGSSRANGTDIIDYRVIM